MNPSILLTIDVEDWFQVENFKSYIPFSTWDSKDFRIEKNIHTILDLLDSVYPQQKITNTQTVSPKATFFILGWIAERFPLLVQEVHNRGHEVASHGYNHDICSNLSDEELKKDLTESRKILEDTISSSVEGYRAPNFSISDNILKMIEHCGYQYDSSYNSFSGNERYGSIDLTRAEKKDACYKINNNFFELPISNFQFKKRVIPLGGGGYFRLFPFYLFKLGMKSVLKNNKAFIFYVHPWEFDPSQPLVEQASSVFKFRHYINLNKTKHKLNVLMKSFSDHNFITCRDYIKKNYNL